MEKVARRKAAPVGDAVGDDEVMVVLFCETHSDRGGVRSGERPTTWWRSAV